MDVADIEVVKRGGDREQLDLDKIHKVVNYACEGITGVSESEVQLKSHISFFDGITTTDIQETLIKAAADLITEDTPNYQWVASRLINYHLRRMVYGDIEPWPILQLVKKNVADGFYDAELLDMYDDDEWGLMDGFIRHNRDYNIAYAGMEQFRGKYLIQNRVTKEIKETPQMAYMLIGAVLFAKYPKESRMKWVRDFYTAVSTFQISLATPIMAGCRSPSRQSSSCVLIECGDSINSINATSSAIVKYVSQRAGIGVGAGAIRAIGSAVRNGQAYHTGAVPYYKMFQAAVSSANQGGIRRGSITVHFPIWSYEFNELIMLKNNKGTEEASCRGMDYSVQISKYFYEKLIKGGNISFFSTSEVPGLYEAYFEDADKFKELYEAAEADETIRRRTRPASEVFVEIMNERKNTGRIYIYNVDNVRDHGSFKPEVAPIRQSNLCQEISLCTRPLEHINDGATMYRVKVKKDKVKEFEEYQKEHGKILYDSDLYEITDEKDIDPNYEYYNRLVADKEGALISLCTLGALNWGVIAKPEDFQKPCEILVRALDALLSWQDYPLIAAEVSTMLYRPLGIGIINFAYWAAKNDMTYSRPKLRLVDEWAEAWSYYLIEASVKLAEEKGPCLGWKDTRYGDGIVPCDTRKPEVDELISHQENLPWDELRTRLKKSGIRSATLHACMPSESSSQISNSTNGLEPPRAPVSIKQSKDGVLKQVVPGIHKMKDKYEYLWDQKSPVGYLKIMAVIQSWCDQALSVNTSYNPNFYKNRKIPMTDLLEHMLLHFKLGGKTLYYCNTNDGAGEIDVDQKLSENSGQTETENIEQQEEVCDSCTI